MKPLTERQASWVCSRVGEWMRLKQEHEDDADLHPPDADHSSLLRRLLAGEDPLSEPPPRRYSYPDYEWCEGKARKVSDASAWKEVWSEGSAQRIEWDDAVKGHAILIEQSFWTCTGRGDDGSVYVRWPDSDWGGVLRATDEEFRGRRVWTFERTEPTP